MRGMARFPLTSASRPRAARAACCLALALLMALPARGDTLLGLCGDRVAGGGHLMAQIFDTDQLGAPRFVRRRAPREGGLGYVGLTPVKGDGLAAGVNERGLVVLTTYTPVFPLANAGPGLDASDFLDRFTNVDEIVAAFRRRELRGPRHVLAGDRDGRLLLLELLPDGTGGFQELRDGVLAHTDHYLLPGMERRNYLVPPASAPRCALALALLALPPRFTREQLVAVTANHTADATWAPLCRHREDPASAGADSVAALVVVGTPGQPPRLYVGLGHPCQFTLRELHTF